jgi:hypothetical protein
MVTCAEAGTARARMLRRVAEDRAAERRKPVEI